MDQKLGKRSIRNKIVLQFSLLVTVIILLIIVSISFLFLKNIEEQAYNTLELKAIAVQNKIESRINYLIENTELLSKNELMVNALIDDEGKKNYLTPLTNNFMEGKNVESLNVVDFDGKIIFRSSDNVPKYNDSKYLRKSLAIGELSYYLNQKTNRLIVISPIKYYNTTQGALIATFNLNKNFDSFLLQHKQEYIKILYKSTLVYTNNFFSEIKYFSYLLTPESSSLFYKFGVELEIGIFESVYLSPIKDAVVKVSLFGLGLLIVGVFFSYLLALSITNPIIKLFKRISEDKYNSHYEELGTNDELEILSKAFYDKTSQLSESEKLVQSVINGIEDLIFFKDENFKYIGCNDAFVNFIGKSRDEIIGSSDFDLFPKKMATSFRRIDINLIEENGVKVRNEWISLREKQLYFQTVKSIFKYDMQSVGILGISRDITELQKLQEEEIRKQKLLSQQSKMASMGEMIGNIAHQWRQPLSVISTASTGMSYKKELGMDLADDEILKLCAMINENTQYLSRTIDDFTNFIKGDTQKELFNLTKNIKSFLILTEGTIKSNDINICLDLDDTIEINGYQNELSQCIINIFNNAKDALNEQKEKDKYFFISTYKVDDRIFIKLRDNAGGIKKEIITKIFDPYFTTKHAGQGTGIGLHMTYNLIVDGMDGSIEVQNVSYEHNNKKCKGAEFILIFPVN